MTFSTITRTKNAPAVTRPQGISVLPAVDVNLGAVTFLTPSGHRAYYSAEPSQLVSALTQAVRPARWIPEIGTLVITVAQTGARAGRHVGFRLSAY
ncbi:MULTISPECIES: hypothetical protein [Arthrobacter]|uniref:hypothetical protein n=1 Tax=Arthrobacter TaxID=1663 RepID=UPI0028F74102|nr:hypothetical protein [Arthrobacter sp. lap29]